MFPISLVCRSFILIRPTFLRSRRPLKLADLFLGYAFKHLRASLKSSLFPVYS